MPEAGHRQYSLWPVAFEWETVDYMWQRNPEYEIALEDAR